MSQVDKLLLVDGHNLLFQMFFGMPAKMFGKENKPIHGTIGFVGGLLKMINIINPTHLAVIFDGERGSDRVEINSDYKANRIDYSLVPDIENPFTQLVDIKAALNHMKINHYETYNIETDDVISGYALTYGNEMQIVIASSDTDFFQLVNDNVSTFVYRGKNSVINDVSNVYNRYGIYPHLFADYKSLVGDPSDNIKGVPRIGSKTAARLLNQYGNVDMIIEHIDEITPISIKESLKNNIEKLRENLLLIKLNKNVSLPFDIEELRLNNLSKEMSTMKILRDIEIL